MVTAIGVLRMVVVRKFSVMVVNGRIMCAQLIEVLRGAAFRTKMLAWTLTTSRRRVVSRTRLPTRTVSSMRRRTVAAARDPQASVADLLETTGSSRAWNCNFKRSLTDEKMKDFLALSALFHPLPLSRTNNNTILWSPNPTDQFSISSLYHVLLAQVSLPVGAQTICSNEWLTFIPPLPVRQSLLTNFSSRHPFYQKVCNVLGRGGIQRLMR
ncbi:hypothetical protein AMTR_s00062p00167400 [Amborella trichopoda]|uniref:Uncharacterized protein n=1 Tax=Amborella trichopoda TaxID=13333 RepID=U5DAW2_AMBTC|nr:hypothetical protein AMTR_s00062p00167400 [Amborella trichopoda]